MDTETNFLRITQRCSGPFDSRAERRNAATTTTHAAVKWPVSWALSAK